MPSAAVLLFALLPPGGGAPVAIAAVPRQASILPGAPLVTEVRFTNPTDAAIAFDLGADRLEAFSVTIRDGEGKAVRTSERISAGGGLHMVGRLTLPPRGGEHVEPLVLNRWVSTRLPAGSYEVTVHVRTAEDRWMSLEKTGEEAASILLRAEAKFRVTIAPPDEAALVALFDRLKEGLLQRHVSAVERQLRGTMLFETDAPAAVGALSDLALFPTPPKGKGPWWDWYGARLEAIKALSGIESVEAVVTLAKVAAIAERGSNEYRHAVGGVYLLHDTTVEPAVKRATEAVVRIYPRVGIPIVAD